MGLSPLYVAAKSLPPSPTAVQVLIEQGADVRHELPDGSTLLHAVCGGGSHDDTGATVQRLLRLNPIRVSLNRRAFPRGGHRSVRWHMYCLVARVAVKLRGLPRVKQPLRRLALSYGGTALHCAMIGGNVRAVEILVAAGADVNMVDGSGRTPLQAAQLAFGGQQHVPHALCEALLPPAAGQV